MPTSLTYFVQIPEAANLGDLMRIWARSRVWIFILFYISKARKGMPDTPKDKVLYLKIHPISRQSDFRVPANNVEKTTPSGPPAYNAKINSVTIFNSQPGWQILAPKPVEIICMISNNDT